MSGRKGPEWYEAISDIGREIGHAVDEQIEARIEAVDDGLKSLFSTSESDDED